MPYLMNVNRFKTVIMSENLEETCIEIETSNQQTDPESSVNINQSLQQVHELIKRGLEDIVRHAADLDILEKPFGRPTSPQICTDEDDDDFYDPPFVFDYGKR